MMQPLHLLFRRAHHVVAQVIETKFIVGAVGDIGLVSSSALLRVRLVLINAINPHFVELQQRAHPFGVTYCQVVIYRYNVHSVTC